MHEYLRATIDRLTAHFIGDPRCLGVLLHGSGGEGTDDIYSDIDLTVVVAEKDYLDVREGLKSICSSVCGDIRLWYPEGEGSDHVNFAFLFEAMGIQFLCDLAIVTLAAYSEKSYDPAEKILFDREHRLQALHARQPRRNIPSQAIPGIIEVYWLYAYLNGKYFRRGDRYKAIYILQTLFRHHMRLLGAFYPDTGWGWWPKDMQKLTTPHQQDMLSYLQCPNTADLPRHMTVVLDRFSRDARAVCAQSGLDYPDALEAYVRRHLLEMGALTE